MRFGEIFNSCLNPWGKPDLIEAAELMGPLSDAWVNNKISSEICAFSLDNLVYAGFIASELKGGVTHECIEWIGKEVITPRLGES